jgi:RimJ/RimL family protein N-acetyltransferase
MTRLDTQSKPLFTSERLAFRAFSESDFDALKSLHQHPDVAITTFTGFSDDVRVLEELNEYIEEYSRLGISQLYVSEKETGRFVGRMGLQHRVWNPERNEREYELRVAIHPDFWSKGFATEGSRAVLQYAFEELRLPKIVMAHFDDNTKSEVISQKLGFVRTCDFYYKGRIVIGYEQLNPSKA